MIKDTEELERRLKQFIEAMEVARRQLGRETQESVSELELQTALLETMQLEGTVDLLDTEWSAARIVDTLRDYDFRRLRPTELQRISSSVDLLPGNIPRHLVEQQIK